MKKILTLLMVMALVMTGFTACGSGNEGEAGGNAAGSVEGTPAEIIEKIYEQPLIFVDGSHNPHGIKATAASLRTYFPQGGITFLVGVLADKDAIHMMEELPDMASSFVTITSLEKWVYPL